MKSVRRLYSELFFHIVSIKPPVKKVGRPVAKEVGMRNPAEVNDRTPNEEIVAEHPIVRASYFLAWDGQFLLSQAIYISGFSSIFGSFLHM